MYLYLDSFYYIYEIWFICVDALSFWLDYILNLVVSSCFILLFFISNYHKLDTENWSDDSKTTSPVACFVREDDEDEIDRAGRHLTATTHTNCSMDRNRENVWSALNQSPKICV